MGPLVSVLIPVYNAEKYLKEAIESILKQTYRNIEVLLIDDCSTDSSLKIIRNFSDPRIKVICNSTNLKQPKTRNKGFEIASGKYVLNMDSDDISLPTRIEQQVKFMESHSEVDICGCYAKRLVNGKKNRKIIVPVDSNEIRAYSMTSSPFIHPTVIFRAESIRKNKIYYDDNFPYAQDYELWSRLAFRNIVYANIPSVLYLYRISDEQIGSKHKSEQKQLANKITQRNLSRCFGSDNLFHIYETNMKYEDIIRELKQLSELTTKIGKSKFFSIYEQYRIIHYAINTLVVNNTEMGIPLLKNYIKFQDKVNYSSYWFMKFFIKCILKYKP